ncbi:MAG: hypothetical protein R6V05_00470, partial [Candidatus Brocadiia bacterium]
MCTHLKRWVVALAVAALLSASVARAGEAEDVRALQLFEQAITAYQTGEYEQAREAFDELLTLEPSMRAALQMRDQAELGVLFQMKERDELAEQVERIMEMMMRAVREQRKPVRNPDDLIASFTSDKAAVYGKARVNLRGYGPYAVPYLVPLLEMEEVDQQEVVGRTFSLLADLQRDACLPLIEVLRNSRDSLVRTRVAAVLGHLGDVRAVPALMAAWESPDSAAPVAEAAAGALKNIADKTPEELGSAVEQYVELGKAYFREDAPRVGYTFGVSADIWKWNADGETMPEKLVYETIPNYLYYQRMAEETALDGLALAPGNTDLQALLGGAVVRQLALCETYSSEEVMFGGEPISEETRQDAARRAEAFSVQAPVLLSLLQTPVAARALSMTLDARDPAASLYLVKAVRGKLNASTGMPSEATVAALLKGLRSGMKDVRYNASITLMHACPGGDCGEPQVVTDVMAAALNVAASRHALILVDDFQTRNTLTSLLRGMGLATIETKVNEGSIQAALAMQPSVDIVFISAGAPELLFARVVELLQTDPRTKGLPIYAIVGPEGPVADVAGSEAVTEILTADDIRPAKLQPIVEQEVLAKSRSAFTEEEEMLVLKAVQAVSAVDPARTEYPMGQLEPALIKALRGYRDEVTLAAVDALAAVGSEQCLLPLARIVRQGSTSEMKADACYTAAAVMKRTGAGAPDQLRSALDDTLAGDEQALREAAAEALGVAGT